jgi:hypothetical protein
MNTFEGTLPYKVGFAPGQDIGMQLYIPKIVETWKQDRLFNQVTVLTHDSFLYRNPKDLDYIIEVSGTGTWVVNKINILEGLFIDLTLGFAGMPGGIGNELSGVTILNVVVVDTKSGNEFASYSIEARTVVEYGIAADINVVTATADNIQSRKLAILLAERLRVDLK